MAPGQPSFYLRFDYATGPPVVVDLDGCTATTGNGSLADGTAQVLLTRIAAALR